MENKYYVLPLKCSSCDSSLTIIQTHFNAEELMFECLCVKCGEDITLSAKYVDLITVAERHNQSRRKANGKGNGKIQ